MEKLHRQEALGMPPELLSLVMQRLQTFPDLLLTFRFFLLHSLILIKQLVISLNLSRIFGLSSLLICLEVLHFQKLLSCWVCRIQANSRKTPCATASYLQVCISQLPGPGSQCLLSSYMYTCMDICVYISFVEVIIG